MATWVTHLLVADEVIRQVPFLSMHEFYVGNIAPDCNVENEDWTSFTPSREVTHWIGKKLASIHTSVCQRKSVVILLKELQS